MYDGTATAAADVKLVGVIDDDHVTANKTAAFADASAGINKPVTVQYSLPTTGDAANYSLVSGSSSVSASILQKEVTASGYTINDKQFDGSTNATWAGIPTLDGVIGDDTVGVGITSARFDTPQAGTGKPVTVRFGLSGGDKDNYSIAAATEYASILPVTQPAYTKSATSNVSASSVTERIGSISMRQSKAQGTFRPASYADWIRYLK